MQEKTGPRDLRQQTSVLRQDKLQNLSSKWIMSSDSPYAENPDTPTPIPCEFCGALRYHKGFLAGDRIIWMPSGPERCTCEKAIESYQQAKFEAEAKDREKQKAEEETKLRQHIRRIIGQSGMGERFLRRTFGTFQITDNNRKAVAAAKRYADNFDNLMPKRGEKEPGRNSLFISGPPGTGKTHLAAAIANHLIMQGRPIICMTMIDLLERIKQSYSKQDIDEGSVLRIYKTVPLLVMDDIGKEPPTDWAISTVYNIINGRYEAYLPTIVTTNYDTDTLIARMTARDTPDDTTARAIIDRLMEMCHGIPLTGESWRQK